MENRRSARRTAAHSHERVDPPEWAEFEDLRAERAPDGQRHAAALQRLMDAEQILYDRWETHNGSDQTPDPVGMLLSLPVTPEDDDPLLRILGLGERVAALGGPLEIRAVFADEQITLLTEPGPDEQPPILERPGRLPRNGRSRPERC